MHLKFTTNTFILCLCLLFTPLYYHLSYYSSIINTKCINLHEYNNFDLLQNIKTISLSSFISYLCLNSLFHFGLQCFIVSISIISFEQYISSLYLVAKRILSGIVSLLFIGWPWDRFFILTKTFQPREFQGEGGYSDRKLYKYYFENLS